MRKVTSFKSFATASVAALALMAAGEVHAQAASGGVKVGGTLTQRTTVNGNVSVESGGFGGLGAKSTTNVGNIENIDVGGQAVQTTFVRRNLTNEGGTLEVGSIKNTKVGGQLRQTTTVLADVSHKSGGFLGLGKGGATEIGKINGADVGGSLTQTTTIRQSVSTEGGCTAIGLIGASDC
ncbi:MAG: hypothetical protein KDE35_03020 [Geminicoccaceae bacterium]|nr:hypothetical protein [Geminicoccaceae bacterium]